MHPALIFHSFNNNINSDKFYDLKLEDYISLIDFLSLNFEQGSITITFDDGFKDHIKYVMPELLSRKLSGTFFPPEAAIRKSKILNVHSIHHILSCVGDIDEVFQDLNILCKQNGITDKQIKFYYKNQLYLHPLTELQPFLHKLIFLFGYLF